MITLTQSQNKILESILDWYKSKSSPYLTLGGYAGTGKTTLIGFLRKRLKEEKVKKIAFCAFTGKASRVLKWKLDEVKAVFPGDSVSTIHSLIYHAKLDSKGEVVAWERKPNLGIDLIIVDEASMIDQYIWNDLLSYHIPILAVGDHGQLPPIGGKFNLMDQPELKLEEIHRQASENPIIHLSMIAREEGEIKVGDYGRGIRKLSRYDSDSREEMQDAFDGFDENTLVLCGRNKTRIRLNQQIRGQLGFEEPGLEVGERVICLKNNHKIGIVNGMQGYVLSLLDEDEFHYVLEISLDFEDQIFKGEILKAQIDAESFVGEVEGLSKRRMGQRFDRGYALTVHKAQGSQAPKVVLFEERFQQMDDEIWRKWLYTAVTRAEEELLIVG